MSNRYRKTVLPGGIRVISERIPHTRSISLGVWVRAGSRFESVEQNGVAHFLEHMLFKGTTKRNAFQIAQSIESLGGYLNAFTGRELNCYFIRILDEHIAIAIEVLADILQHSIFDPEEIAKEKSVVIDEIMSVQDAPEELVQDYFTTLVWEPHPLGRPILGTESTVSRFTDRDLESYLKTRYQPDQIYIIAAGNIDHETLTSLVSRFFILPPGNQSDRVVPVPTPSVRSQIAKKDILQTHICLGAQSLPYRDPRRYSLFILNTVLGGGMTSRLFQSIREEAGLAYSIYSDLEFCEDTGLFYVSVGTDALTVSVVLEMIYQQCERLRAEPISDNEINDAKSQLIGNLYLSLESSTSVMNRIARMEIYLDSYQTVDETIAAIQNVSTEQVRALAEELLDPRRICTVVLGPVDDQMPAPQ